MERNVMDFFSRVVDSAEEADDLEKNSEGISLDNQEHPKKDKSKERISVFKKLEEQIKESDLDEAEKTKRLARLMQLSKENVNIMLVGATGSGKSSTINALFDMEVAKVGVGVGAETDEITKYELENLNIWDTPGLGDGKRADKKYKDMLVRKLNELDEDGNLLIDLVLVVLDASSKDLGTSYELINDVIIPCLGDEAEKRIIIALNQADVAMKGRHWNADENAPDEKLTEYLKEKADSVQERILEATGISIRPIYYCAGYTDEDGDRCDPYNLPKLLYYILNSIPSEKRLVIADNLNPNEDAWLHDDEEIEYTSSGGTGFGPFDMIGIDVEYYASEFGDMGAEILGIPGRIAGMVLGTGIGVIAGIFDSI